MFHHHQEHDEEAERFVYKLTSDLDYFEQFFYKDVINDYNNIIEQLQKQYEQTPASDYFMRARIQSGLEQSKRDLAKTQAEYDKFKEYKTRTAICK